MVTLIVARTLSALSRKKNIMANDEQCYSKHCRELKPLRRKTKKALVHLRVESVFDIIFKYKTEMNDGNMKVV